MNLIHRKVSGFFTRLFPYLKEIIQWFVECVLIKLLIILISLTPLYALIIFLFFELFYVKAIRISGIVLQIIGTCLILYSLNKKFALIEKPSALQQIFDFEFEKFPKFNRPVIFTAPSVQAGTQVFDVTTYNKDKSEDFNYLENKISLLEQKFDKAIKKIRDALDVSKTDQSSIEKVLHKSITPDLLLDISAVVCLISGMIIGLIVEIYQ